DFDSIAGDSGEVHLHLLARRCLEAHNRIVLDRLEGGDIGLELRYATLVSMGSDLVQQHRSRYPVRLGGLDTTYQVRLVGIQFGRTGCPVRVLRQRGQIPQVASNGIAGYAECFGYAPDALA